jgi:hypothetical protein
MTRTTTNATLGALALAASIVPAAHAQISISPVSKFAWSENCGYLNFRDAGNPPTAQGVRVYGSYVSGYIWGENIGWINLDDATKFVGLQCPADLDNGTGNGIPDSGVDINDLLFFHVHFEGGC